jgi:hypothetical protein
MKKYSFLICLLMLSFSNSTLKATNTQSYDAFEEQHFQQADLPSSQDNPFVAESSTNPFIKSNDAFNGGVFLRDEDCFPGDPDCDLEEGGTDNPEDACVDCALAVPVGSSVFALLLLAIAYGSFLFIRKKQLFNLTGKINK